MDTQSRNIEPFIGSLLQTAIIEIESINIDVCFHPYSCRIKKLRLPEGSPAPCRQSFRGNPR